MLQLVMLPMNDIFVYRHLVLGDQIPNYARDFLKLFSLFVCQWGERDSEMKMGLSPTIETLTQNCQNLQPECAAKSCTVRLLELS